MALVRGTQGAPRDAAALAAHVYKRDGITGAGGQPFGGEDLEPFVASFQERKFGGAEPPPDQTANDAARNGPDGAPRVEVILNR
ncbi:hypothetical protein ABZ876_36980 [Streptomyces sp. NPDC046931]|uniref:hypothetical protein n=1 Tax=Streptomyces sp. NPDC046931 TaxID=3154806 RepID=UPI0033FC8CBE